MKTKTLLYLCVLLTATLACRNNNTDQPDAKNSTVLTAEDRDSLYQYYLNKKPNDYPTDAILEKGKLYPEDAAPLDSSFLIYRGRLLEAVQNKDLIALLSMLDQNIKCSFGDCTGKAGFAQLWELDNPDQIGQSPLWQEMEKVLVEGGSFDDSGHFAAPYIYANWAETYDAYEYGVIAGRMVRMRAEPRLGTGIVKNLTHDVVKIVDRDGPDETINGETHPWVELQTLDDKNGHVWGKFVASSIDFRAGFQKKAGDWKMTFFLAGD